MERSAVSPAPWRKAGPAGAPSPSRHPWRDDAGHPPAATPNVRDPFRVAGEGPGATTHPRSPAPISVNWVLRDSDPGMASASMGSFFRLLTSSSFCPSSVFRESLGRSLSSGRPFCPSHPGLPCYPGILGLRAGANSRRPSSGEGGWVALPIIPPGEAPVGLGEVQEHHPPHPGGHDAAVPRRLSSALPIPLLAPPGFPLGTGKP
jgi:hypothetical protein